MRAPWRIMTVAAALALGLTGCAIGGGDSKGSDGEAAGATGPAEAVDTSRSIVKQTFDSPMAPGAKVEIAIVDLRVTGKLAQLTLAVTPQVPAGAPAPTLYRLNGNHSLDASLLDTVNLKRHRVVKAGTEELEPEDLKELGNNQRNILTYTFAAPPESVPAVDVMVGEWGPFRNVPVSR
ncbi:hypothetical protein [Thermomonospora cellulosilytica]|uniref:Lipoprotein n=1 Tax=Thermomonospora cellulosilytica TaxID=1411118 RepID=A0A7W3MXE4_9ACTN|nr:hypothetical protein [Thermomonospora cellulosilytica]MBA9003621.1 hypothetical protein [Thermomonospora cellulosilytica]